MGILFPLLWGKTPFPIWYVDVPSASLLLRKLVRSLLAWVSAQIGCIPPLDSKTPLAVASVKGLEAWELFMVMMTDSCC